MPRNVAARNGRMAFECPLMALVVGEWHMDAGQGHKDVLSTRGLRKRSEWEKCSKAFRGSVWGKVNVRKWEVMAPLPT